MDPLEVIPTEPLEVDSLNLQVFLPQYHGNCIQSGTWIESLCLFNFWLLIKMIVFIVWVLVRNLVCAFPIYNVVDNMLIVGEKSLGNVRALKQNVFIWVLIWGSPINFHKSLLEGLNVAKSWLVEASVVLNCKMAKYLLFIWAFLLVVILAVFLSCILWSIISVKDCQVGKVKTYQWMVDFLTHLSCLRFWITFFPFSRYHQV